MIGLFSRAFHFVWRDAPCMSYTTAASRKSLHRVKHSNMYWIGFVLILALITIPPGSLGNLAAKRYRSTCDTNPSDLHLTKGNFQHGRKVKSERNYQIFDFEYPLLSTN